MIDGSKLGEVSIFKTRWFDRWAHKQGLTDDMLCRAVAEMVAGLFDADLGGGLLKKRLARPGQGKSGGFRTLVATKREDRWFFVFGFPKSERSNIDKDEQEALQSLAAYLLKLPNVELTQALRAGELIGVHCDA